MSIWMCRLRGVVGIMIELEGSIRERHTHTHRPRASRNTEAHGWGGLVGKRQQRTRRTQNERTGQCRRPTHWHGHPSGSAVTAEPIGTQSPLMASFSCSLASYPML